MRVLRVTAVLATSALALGVSGCGGDEEAAPPTQATPGGTTASTTTTAATTGDRIDPLEGAGTGPVTGPGGDETALLERITLGHHEGFDRVVFQFRNALPGYRVEYVRPPLFEDGSGARIAIEGAGIVQVRMEPASGFDLSVPEGDLVYRGPRRIEGAGAGTSIVRELVRTGDFEAVLGWAIGLEERVDFRVRTLDGPPRLVVDFRSH